MKTREKQKEFQIPITPKELGRFDNKLNTFEDALLLYNAKIATTEDTSFSHRVINHWESLGLLPYKSGRKMKWRRFCLEDLCWIQIIGELREFGLAIEKIKEVKKVLFSEIRIPNKSHTGLRIYTKLEVPISKILFEKKESFLVVYSDGKAEIVSDFDVKKAKNNFIFIRFSNILEKVFQSENVAIIYNNPELNEEEIALLLLIRSGVYESITIHFNDGKIEKFDEVKNLGAIRESVEKIKRLLEENNYQEIIVKQQQGSVVSIKQRIKTMATL